MQRHNATKNVLALLVNLVAAVVFIFVADVDWTRRRPDRRRLGRSAARSAPPSGRRLPSWALRAFIVVVGVAAMVQFLAG